MVDDEGQPSRDGAKPQVQAGTGAEAGAGVSATLGAPSRWMPWLVALVLFVIAIETAPEVLDFDTVEGGLLAVVAAAAAFPFGLIATRAAPIAWLVSAGSAMLIALTIPAHDADPWPWPTVHGLVLLALLFAVALRPPPDLSSAQQTGTIVVVWAGTAALFGASVPERLRAGWIFGVTAIVAAAILLSRLGWLKAGGGSLPIASFRTGSGNSRVNEWLSAAADGFREAFVNWVRSPPLGPPLARRLLRRLRWAHGVRSGLPWLLAIAVFWISVASIHETLVVHDLVLPFLAALIALPIGIARHHALLGWRLVTALAVVLAIVGTPSRGQDPGTWPVIMDWVWLATTFLVSARHGRWTTGWVWAATVATLSAGTADNAGTAASLIFAASALVLIGDLLRTRRLASREVARQTELSELEKARRTVLEERARIARDLHDVVAHHMSMVVVQTETAPYRLPDLSEAAKAEFAAVSTSARQALTEIRGMLGVLRSEDHAAATAPQPGLDQLAELVESVSRSGVPVEMTTVGEPGEASAAAGLSAYRIVQESLANAARHAPGASVAVEVTYGDDAVTLRITNSPPAAAAGPVTPDPAGHGLISMRERAHAVGGSLRAGSLPDGEFEVLATIPYTVHETAEEQPREQ